jgi:hypothetical protein
LPAATVDLETIRKEYEDAERKSKAVIHDPEP